jgi:type II secretory pathway pseudopilin PulG
MATAAVCRPGAPRRGAFTLLELLVAMALTLLLVYGLAEFYSYVGDTVRDGRAIVEMGGNIRNAVRQLRDDLNSVTVHPRPPIDDSKGAGFLEIVEGVASDFDFNGNLQFDQDLEIKDTNNDGLVEGRMLGDMDDVLTMTIRSSGAPFVGHYQFFDENSGQFSQRTVESHLAEVIWFTTFKDLNNDGSWDPGEPPGAGNDFDGDGQNPEFEEPRFLVRRMLLIAPNIAGWRDANGNDHFGELVDPSVWPRPTPRDGDNIFQHDDVSLAAPTFNQSLGSNGRWVWKANSLAALSQRENRFVHLNLDDPAQNGLLAANNFMPNRLWLQAANTLSMKYFTLQNTLQGSVQSAKHGEDLVLPNLLALDIRVYDPSATLFGDDPANPLAALQPGDPGYNEVLNRNQSTPNTYNPIGYGAYVDLFYNRYLPTALTSHFAGRPAYNPRNTGTPDPYLAQYVIYDTWSTYYERDGYDQFGDGAGDQAFDGLDNDQEGGIDNAPQPTLNYEGEFETTPPYLAPLRGVQIRLRMYEPGTRQTRQATIVADFVQE